LTGQFVVGPYIVTTAPPLFETWKTATVPPGTFSKWEKATRTLVPAAGLQNAQHTEIIAIKRIATRIGSRLRLFFLVGLGEFIRPVMEVRPSPRRGRVCSFPRTAPNPSPVAG
jgi:hypothetical protein